MRILSVRLQAAESLTSDLERFYGERLGLPIADRGGFQIGATRLVFDPAEGEPFYHFALRVPRNRFVAARDWIGTHAEVLAEAEFDNWSAEACYVEDPAGNIVELIAHHELPEETSGDEPFSGKELLGMCELGLVGPGTQAMAKALEEIDIELWDGTLEPGRLAFMGGREGILILCPTGRGWMPTERPAEPHAVEAVVTGARQAEAKLPGTLHRISATALA
jgi:catechol 2,3-dioxygenase-like lactoylglutathione lyase family enzyme